MLANILTAIPIIITSIAGLVVAIKTGREVKQVKRDVRDVQTNVNGQLEERIKREREDAIGTILQNRRSADSASQDAGGA